MKKETDLAIRMKSYEERQDFKLLTKMPVVVRIDGRAFHTFTKGMVRPFDDDVLLEAMRRTALYLCKNISGCVFGYTQSDEITLVLTDYENYNSQPWFDYRIQKICSITASMATKEFNTSFRELVNKKYEKISSEEATLYRNSIDKAMFDSRAYNMPIDDVPNVLYWRQLDASKNSVSQVAQSMFSNKELHGKNQADRIDMLFEKGLNWYDMPIYLKRGTCVVQIINDKKEKEWIVDKNAPIFKNDWNYITDRIKFEDDFKESVNM